MIPTNKWTKFFAVCSQTISHQYPPIMEDEERRDITKQPSERTPFRCLEQVSSDFVLAMALQEQETSFPMLETIESESESEEENESNGDDDDSYNTHFEYEVFQSSRSEVVPELEFILDEESSSEEDDDDGMEEDMVGLDVDELTYEELIALGEFIGVEKRGLSTKEISSCLNPFVCKSSQDQNTSGDGIDRCVICQVEYEDGEALVAVLPCQHPYHSECIAKWLRIKKCCPICTTEVVSSTNKIN